jgi:hypothetical protein
MMLPKDTAGCLTSDPPMLVCGHFLVTPFFNDYRTTAVFSISEVPVGDDQ